MVLVTQPKSYQYWAAIAATPADFTLDAGDYGFTLLWTAGTVQLQKLMPDGVTAAPITAALGASGYTFLQLPAGQYRLVVVTGPVTATIEKINRGRS
jgi:hypothetical protein